MDIQTTATAVENAVEGFMKIEPTLATVASMFVPGAAPVVAMVQPEILIAIPFLEQALKRISAGQNMDAASAIYELIGHLLPGQPNSPVLSAVAATLAPIALAPVAPAPIAQDGLDASKMPVG
jgi:hypothetical protein